MAKFPYKNILEGVKHIWTKSQGPDAEGAAVTANPLTVGYKDAEGKATGVTPTNMLPVGDAAAQAKLADILTKLSADPATQTTLAAILNKIIAAPATEAKQTALNALIGEVQAAPTANTLLARLKSLEDKIDKITAGTTPAVTTLSGSNITNAQAIPTAQAHKDIIKYSIDNIIDIIGSENIKLFLPMWETSGITLSDLLNRSLTFTVAGATLAQAGPFGNCLSFDGVNDYVIQNPVIDAFNSETTSSSQELQAPTAIAVQKLKTFSTNPSFIRLGLSRKGSPDGSVKLEIRESKDGAAIANGVSGLYTCTSILSITEYTYGFPFTTPPNLQKDKTYYLALVYDGNTNADANNNIRFYYKSAVSAYGQGRHYFDGTSWTDTATEDHAFSVYNNDLSYSDDFTIFVLAKNTSTNLTASSIYGHGGLRSINLSTYPRLQYNESGIISAAFYDTAAIAASFYRNPLDSFNVWAFTFQKALDTNKVTLYCNGKPVASGSGAAATAHAAIVQPMTFGAHTTVLGNQSAFFKGNISTAIMVNNAMTSANIAKVSHEMLALRKMQEVF